MTLGSFKSHAEYPDCCPEAADGAEPKGHVEECSECKECLPSPGDVVGPLQPDKSSKASSNDVAESIRVEGPLGMI